MGIRVASVSLFRGLQDRSEFGGIQQTVGIQEDPGPKKRETGSRTCHHCQNRSRRKVHSAEEEAALDGGTWSDGQRRSMSEHSKWTRFHFDLAHPENGGLADRGVFANHQQC
jgi:hypothetical protein